MLLKKSRILYDQLNTGDTGGAGGYNNAQVPPPVTPPTPNSTPTQTQGDQFDNFGYPIKPAVPPPPQATQNQGTTQGQPNATTTPQQEPTEVGTGYEKPIEAPVTPPPATPPATPPPTDDKNKIVTDFGNLSEADKKSFSEYFDKHNLPKEARDALVEIRKNEIATQQQAKVELEKQIKLEETKLRSNWYNELKTDKDFGGANFDANLKTVNNFMTNFLPGLKKMLTDKAGMLPPVVMKEYLSIAKKLNETEKLVNGDPGAPETKPTGKYDFLTDYYKTN